MLVACGGDGDAAPSVVCASDIDCASDASCRASRCIGDGSVGQGEVCTKQRQCGSNLLCEDQVCKAASCSVPYSTQGCGTHQWCKPSSDGGDATCEPSQCGSGTSASCVGDESCVILGTNTGVCFSPCDYGYLGSAYTDNCVDADGVNLACQPMGISLLGVCLAAGGDDAPDIGEPGCDPMTNPCKEGAVCVDVVCRKLCRDSQANPCQVGESCLKLSPSSTLAACLIE